MQTPEEKGVAKDAEKKVLGYGRFIRRKRLYRDAFMKNATCVSTLPYLSTQTCISDNRIGTRIYRIMTILATIQNGERLFEAKRIKHTF